MVYMTQVNDETVLTSIVTVARHWRSWFYSGSSLKSARDVAKLCDSYIFVHLCVSVCLSVFFLSLMVKTL